jgi:alkyl sulfatase BDS1-like metallo-beta-lactamase superfamily hydrolase
VSRIRKHSEGLWHGEIDPLQSPPFVPLLAWEEVAEGVAFVSSFANATGIATPDGIVLVDTGSFLLSAQVFAAIREWSPARASTIVYTHGHVDHVFGVDRYETEAKSHGWSAPHVVAHEAVAARFDRYKRTHGYNACINARQFQSAVEWPVDYRYPDVTYRERLALDVNGVEIELEHARGETDDATWAWVPARKLLCAGDLFIWAAPNAGNPQKVQRYPLDWAKALRTMAARGAEVMCPGHGPPIWGKGNVHRALVETAELLESLHDQTVALMNEGARLDDIVQAVRAPASLLERPYLRPIYDEPEFIVRAVYRLYGGWWDGNPAELKPAPRARVAAEIAALAGGVNRLVERALALLALGETALACHLVETAFDASPRDGDVQSARKRIYARRAEESTSLMAKGVFQTAADESVTASPRTPRR